MWGSVVHIHVFTNEAHDGDHSGSEVAIVRLRGLEMLFPWDYHGVEIFLPPKCPRLIDMNNCVLVTGLFLLLSGSASLYNQLGTKHWADEG